MKWLCLYVGRWIRLLENKDWVISLSGYDYFTIIFMLRGWNSVMKSMKHFHLLIYLWTYKDYYIINIVKEYFLIGSSRLTFIVNTSYLCPLRWLFRIIHTIIRYLVRTRQYINYWQIIKKVIMAPMNCFAINKTCTMFLIVGLGKNSNNSLICLVSASTV